MLVSAIDAPFCVGHSTGMSEVFKSGQSKEC